jgi:hypothetical protein
MDPRACPCVRGACGVADTEISESSGTERWGTCDEAAPAIVLPGLPGVARRAARRPDAVGQAQPTQVSWFVQGAKYVSGSGHG